MKIFLFIAIAFSVFFGQQEIPHLKGAYKMEYDSKYQLLTSQVIFADSTYVRKMPDGLTSKGKVVYSKYKITLKPSTDNPIEIDGRETAKDTIKFTTKNKADLSVTVNRGHLIHIK